MALLPGTAVYAYRSYHASGLAVDEQMASVSGMVGVSAVPGVLDLGTVAEGAQAEGAFELVNQRNDEILITSVIADCGCTTSPVTHAVIPAGGRTRIPILYQSGLGARGSFQRSVTISLQSKSGQGAARLLVKGNTILQRRLLVFPSNIDFGDVPTEGSARKMIYFRGSTTALSGLPREVTIEAAAASAEWSLDFGRAGDPYDVKAVEIVFNAGHAPPGSKVQSSLRVADTSGEPGTPPVIVPIRAALVGQVYAVPATLVVPAGDSTGSPSEGRVLLRAARGGALEPMVASSDLPITLAIRRGEKSDECELVGAYSGDHPVSEALAGTVHVRFGQSKAALDVPVVLTPGSPAH